MRELNYYLRRTATLTAVTLTAWLLTVTTGLAGPQERAFYWSLRHLLPGVSLDSDYNNLPHAGHDYSAAHQYNVDTYNALYNNGYFMGLMLQNDTAPITGNKDNMALDTVMGYVQRLDYVFADFELSSHAAKRALPATHQLIPWIGGFGPWTGYDVPEPTRTDCRASKVCH